jgi:hypothetical protein
MAPYEPAKLSTGVDGGPHERPFVLSNTVESCQISDICARLLDCSPHGYIP